MIVPENAWRLSEARAAGHFLVGVQYFLPCKKRGGPSESSQSSRCSLPLLQTWNQAKASDLAAILGYLII
ncbi:hypothetical protein DAI22_01g391750 [Oryza sativa Japonica Group]|nr:hypothetical protein DAI22_01g391750 [Oryza sativa Japonica Group]